MWFVSNKRDAETAAVVLGESAKLDDGSLKGAEGGGTKIYFLDTDLFTAGGAVFGKWQAVEWALDQMGRRGWIALLDADVVWPREAPFPDSFCPGMLLSPLRRMCPAAWCHRMLDDESSWKCLPVHRNVNEWAGYSQVFFAGDENTPADPRLGPPPWHEIDNIHAGSADSWFQAKWPPALKVRPSWECLHIGAAGENWFGRAGVRLDGAVPPDRDEKLRKISQMWRRRAERRSRGQDQFEEEKVGRK